MAKTKISEYDSTAANNTDIDSINIAEGMAPSNVNNAIRELMAHLKDGLGAGTPVFLDQTNNRVGIGETSPDSDLHISSTANPTISIEDTDNGFAATTLKVENGGRDLDITVPQDTIFTQGSTEAMRILSDGNVGIGTSSPSYGKLHIADGNSDIAMDANGSGQLHIDGNGYGFGIALNASGAQIYTNTASRDLIFGVNETERMRITDGKVGINESSPDRHLHVNGGTENVVAKFESTDTACSVEFTDSTGTVTLETRNDFRFKTGSDIDMMIDSSGNLLVGKTSTSFGTAGILMGGDVIHGIRSGSHPLALNRLSSDGDIAQFYKDSTLVGSIQSRAGAVTTIILDTRTPSSSQGGGLGATSGAVVPANSSGLSDNLHDFGSASQRWDDIFATNGTIQTSDENEKQQIASLTDAEMTAAKAISKLFKTFKWNNSVAEKGANARTHAGVIAQQVETAMSDAGLDAGNYAFFISTTWWETQTEVPAVEADEENGIEAQDAYTRIDTYNTQEEAPEGATERNRKGIRYPELLSFIGAATEQRLTSIEARLDALEG